LAGTNVGIFRLLFVSVSPACSSPAYLPSLSNLLCPTTEPSLILLPLTLPLTSIVLVKFCTLAFLTEPMAIAPAPVWLTPCLIVTLVFTAPVTVELVTDPMSSSCCIPLLVAICSILPVFTVELNEPTFDLVAEPMLALCWMPEPLDDWVMVPVVTLALKLLALVPVAEPTFRFCVLPDPWVVWLTVPVFTIAVKSSTEGLSAWDRTGMFVIRKAAEISRKWWKTVCMSVLPNISKGMSLLQKSWIMSFRQALSRNPDFNCLKRLDPR